MQIHLQGKLTRSLGRFIFSLLLVLLAIAAPSSLRGDSNCYPPDFSNTSYSYPPGFSCTALVRCPDYGGTIWFEWGPTKSYGNTSPTFGLPPDVNQNFSYTPSFAAGPTTVMHFQAAGSSPYGGNSVSGDQTFLSPGWAVITNQPQSQTVSVGTNATFSAGLMSDPSFSPYYYQWYRNGTAISGATNSSLSLTNVQTTDAGNYNVHAANQFGSPGLYWQVSSTAVLTVPAPSLTARLSGTNIVMSWPIAASGYFLESSAVFGTNSWTTVSSPLQTNSSNISITLPATGPQQFYRLHHY